MSTQLATPPAERDPSRALSEAIAGDAAKKGLARSLLDAATPGETAGLDAAAARQLVDFVARAIANRTPGTPAITLETQAVAGGRYRMALAIANDDMPFLVDTVSMAVTGAGLTIDRLLHPIADVRRDADGKLVEFLGEGRGPVAPGATRESIIYLETDRLGARARSDLLARIRHVLGHVRCAVEDWPKMLASLHEARESLSRNAPPIPPHRLHEVQAFLEWLAADNFTLLGSQLYVPADDGSGRFVRGCEPGLGLFRDSDFALWPDGQGAETSPAPLAEFLSGPDPLLITKAGVAATVHRNATLDYIAVKRFDSEGRITGDRRFVGLFTSAALTMSPRLVPLLRRKVGRVTERLGFDPRSHRGKALEHVLESLPRNELYMMSVDEVEHMALGLLSLIDRPRAKLFLRPDPFAGFVSVLVLVPRDDYSSVLRERIGAMLEGELDASLTRYGVELSAEGLARVQFILAVADAQEIDSTREAALDRRLGELVRGWDEALGSALNERLSATRAARLALSFRGAFSASFRAQFSAADAAEDIIKLSELDTPEDRAVRFYTRDGDAPHELRLKIYRLRDVIPLSDAVPVMERFGFRVIEEYPFDLAGGELGWVHDFLLTTGEDECPSMETLRKLVEPALREALTGGSENDVFDALVLGASLDAEAVGWLRAWFRYLRQAGMGYSMATVSDALRRHPEMTRALVELFTARFDPALDAASRAERVQSADRIIEEGLVGVQNIDEDRVLRQYRAVIGATLRTNAFVPGGPEALAFKLDSSGVPGLPRPVPYREIFVYSPRLEGIHLRGGPVARGGIRWSDRRDDFRTEILGLLKAQMVKNTVIVPTGAKGGFYPKQLPPSDRRDAWLAEGAEAYRIFIRALLSVTDNLDGDGKRLPPADVVCYDEPDPYLVVAADKGTASFSDHANEIATGQGFWLGDAFASGGRYGYDHKKMGITARGAWISVAQHFAELGIDVASDPVRVAGVGDMSGDVFGNAMLLSRSLKLVAAFDHRHVFLDPEPDPEASWAERKRLFELPRSSWADYDTSLISRGGGVFPRTQKSIPLTPEVRAMLGTDAGQLPPGELIQAVLRAPVDLLWFGGIGTYMKAAAESNSEVGDRANDAVRVNARTIRARVIGEGANLAVTQAARVAFASRGGRINTDFIDNSAGVDTSDHEVNIKIALSGEVASGRLSGPRRIEVLESMTDEVARLVLADNRLQAQALSIAEIEAATALPTFVRVIQILETSGKLDRAVEGLPTDDLLAQTKQSGAGLERPELAVLLAHAKMALYEAIVGSNLPDDPLLEPDLYGDFPVQMKERFADAIDCHRLRREIIATELANEIVNRGGIPLAFELAEEVSATLPRVATAFLAARELLDLQQLWADIDGAGVPPATRYRLHIASAQALRLHMSDILRTLDDSPENTPLAVNFVNLLKPGIARLSADLDNLLRAEALAARARLSAELARLSAPAPIADRIVRLHLLDGAIGIVRAANALGSTERSVAEAYTLLGEELGLDWAKGAAAVLPPGDHWERLLLADLTRDLEQLRLDLVERRTPSGGDPVASVGAWLDEHRTAVDRIASTVGRARRGAAVTAAMLAHLNNQARVLLAS